MKAVKVLESASGKLKIVLNDPVMLSASRNHFNPMSNNMNLLNGPDMFMHRQSATWCGPGPHMHALKSEWVGRSQERRSPVGIVNCVALLLCLLTHTRAEAGC